MPDSAGPYELVVVGAGPSGLAYALGASASTGQAPRMAVLEAADRPGGWVHTRWRNGYALETGPYGYLDKHPELGEILRQVGLADRAVNPSAVAKNRFVYARGRLRRMPTGPGSFLTTRMLRPRAKLRLLREPWAPPHPGGDESVTDFATRRLGPEAAETLVVPMFTGIYAGDPDRASLASCFPRMAELEAEHGGLFRALWRMRKKVKESGQGVGAPRGLLTSFEGGLITLIQALAESVGDALRLNTPAVEVARAGPGYRVTTGAGDVLETERLVLAAPAKKLVDVVRPLDDELAKILAEVRYGGVSVVHTAYRREDAPGVPEGFGFLVPRQAKRKLLGSVFVSMIFPDQAPNGQLLLRNVLGGMLQPELVEADALALQQVVADEHRELLSITAEPVFSEVVHYPGSLPQYEIGHGDRLARLEARSEALPGLYVTGNAWRGIGLADCLAKNFAAGRDAFAPKDGT